MSFRLSDTILRINRSDIAMRIFVLSLCLLLSISARAGEPFYEEDFASTNRPKDLFAGQLLLGASDPWTGALREGGYELRNSDDGGAVFYLYIDEYEQQDLRSARVSVTARGHYDNEIAGLGLLYRFNSGDRSYLAFTVSHNGFVLWKRSPKGFRQLTAGRHEAIRSEGSNRLTVRKVAGKLIFLVNGQTIAAVSDDHGSGSGVGIFAVGLGAFSFDDFAISKE